jgi:sulfide:quinone oxidoreductase
VSAEARPLAVFGAEASRLVGELLSDSGIRFVGSAVATAVRRDGHLMLLSDAPLKADRVVTVPQLRAHRISGIPASWWGFVPTDALGRVEGLDDVYAAGDVTAFPIKQGGLAAQQGDRVAQTIAALLGAAPFPVRTSYVLQARLAGGERPLFLRTELDWQGRTTAAALVHAEASKPADAPKVFGRYLVPYLEMLGPASHSGDIAAPA